MNFVHVCTVILCESVFCSQCSFLSFCCHCALLLTDNYVSGRGRWRGVCVTWDAVVITVDKPQQNLVSVAVNLKTNTHWRLGVLCWERDWLLSRQQCIVYAWWIFLLWCDVFGAAAVWSCVGRNCVDDGATLRADAQHHMRSTHTSVATFSFLHHFRLNFQFCHM